MRGDANQSRLPPTTTHFLGLGKDLLALLEGVDLGLGLSALESRSRATERGTREGHGGADEHSRSEGELHGAGDLM